MRGSNPPNRARPARWNGSMTRCVPGRYAWWRRMGLPPSSSQKLDTRAWRARIVPE